MIFASYRIAASLLAAVSMMAAGVTAAVGEDLASGVAAGRPMISLPIEKRGGLDDGVRVGDAICYT